MLKIQSSWRKALNSGRVIAKNLSLCVVAAGLTACFASSDGGDTQSPSASITITGSEFEFPDDNNAARFLTQATFGPTRSEIDALVNSGLSTWVQRQFNEDISFFSARVVARGIAEGDLDDNAASDVYWDTLVTADDQLRQRMVYALSQILVVSEARGSDLDNEPLALAYYMDILTRNAFGNFRDLIEEVTYSPAMAIYLTYLRNQKANPDTGSVPDENYAREIMQLFTIGLLELQSDGSPVPGDIETYTNDDVIGLAKVFTGLSLKGGFKSRDADEDALYSRLVIYPEYHSTDEKSFLGVTIPANTGAEASIDIALDTLFNHPNVGPFIGRQLIQRLVTSNPSGPYVQRVARAFESGTFQLPNGDFVGEGRRGDLRATLAAVILDTEARQDPSVSGDSFGKVREPVLRFVQWARAFNIRTANAFEERYLNDMSSNDRLGQHPFRSKSVFNFYRPFYVAPGTATGDANITAPELQILNESTAVGYVNTMSRFVRDDSPDERDVSGNAFSPDYTTEMALADDPAALVAHLDALLTYGRMTTTTRTRITDFLAAMPLEADDLEEDRMFRVHLAVLMAVTSPEYIVQR